MAYSKSSTLLTAILLLTIGCHRSLQIGEPVQLDAGVADAPTVVLDATPEADADAASPPWYVRNEAYIGRELRLPVPDGVTLAGRATMQPATTYADHSLSVSAAPDGHLLVANGNHVASFSMTANGPALDARDGVVVADEEVVLLANRRTAVSFRPSHTPNIYGDQVSVAFGHELAANLAVTHQSFELRTATHVVADPIGLAHATNAAGNVIAEVVRQNSSMLLWQAQPSDRWESQVFDEPLWPWAHAVVAHGDDWFRVVEEDRTVGGASIGAERNVIHVQPLALDPHTPHTLGRDTNLGQPWGADVLSTTTPTQDRCGWMSAAVGDDALLVLCGNPSGNHVRTASLTERRWLSEWIQIPAVGLVFPSIVWDATRTRFALALSGGADRPVRTVTETTVHFISRTGVALGSAPSNDLDRVKLVTWQQQLWAVGVDPIGGIRVYQPESPNRQITYYRPGSQTISSASVHGSAALVGWSDDAQTFVTRLDIERQVERQPHADSAAVLPVPHGRIVTEGDDVFVAATGLARTDNFLESINSSPLWRHAAAVARIDSGTLAIERRFSVQSDRSVADVSLVDGTLRIFSSARRTTGLNIGTNAGLLDRVDVLNRNLTPVTSYALTRRYDNALARCGGYGCASGISCQGTVCTVPTQAGVGVVDFAAATPVEREWQSQDLETFPTCIDREAIYYTGHRFPRRQSGACEDGELWVPGAAAPYRCSVDPLRPEACSGMALASSSSHTLILETRRRVSQPESVRERFVLRLVANGSDNVDAGPVFSLLPDELSGGNAFSFDPTLLLHLRGGLFAIVYSRPNLYRGAREAYARIVYFPEADAVAP